VHMRSTYLRAAPSEELTPAFRPASGTAAAYLRRRPCERYASRGRASQVGELAPGHALSLADHCWCHAAGRLM
jgi:hypothetical protein